MIFIYFLYFFIEELKVHEWKGEVQGSLEEDIKEVLEMGPVLGEEVGWGEKMGRKGLGYSGLGRSFEHFGGVLMNF